MQDRREDRVRVQITVHKPLTGYPGRPSDFYVSVTGSGFQLGNNDLDKAPRCQPIGNNLWAKDIWLLKNSNIKFKFLVIRRFNNAIVGVENIQSHIVCVENKPVIVKAKFNNRRIYTHEVEEDRHYKYYPPKHRCGPPQHYPPRYSRNDVSAPQNYTETTSKVMTVPELKGNYYNKNSIKEESLEATMPADINTAQADNNLSKILQEAEKKCNINKLTMRESPHVDGKSKNLFSKIENSCIDIIPEADGLRSQGLQTEDDKSCNISSQADDCEETAQDGIISRADGTFRIVHLQPDDQGNMLQQAQDKFSSELPQPDDEIIVKTEDTCSTVELQSPTKLVKNYTADSDVMAASVSQNCTLTERTTDSLTYKQMTLDEANKYSTELPCNTYTCNDENQCILSSQTKTTESTRRNVLLVAAGLAAVVGTGVYVYFKK